MIVVGIDVSKDTLVGVAINRSSKVKESFTLPNNPVEISKFLGEILSRYTYHCLL